MSAIVVRFRKDRHHLVGHPVGQKMGGFKWRSSTHLASKMQLQAADPPISASYTRRCIKIGAKNEGFARDINRSGGWRVAFKHVHTSRSNHLAACGQRNVRGGWHGAKLHSYSDGCSQPYRCSQPDNRGGTLYVYNGANGSGTVGAVGAPAYTQAVALTDSGSDAAGFSSIVLTTPFPVTAGSQYSFALSGFALSGTNTNPYAGGTKLDDFAGPSASQDIPFQIFEALAPPAPASSAAIPTMSEWALISMSSILGLYGIAWLRRRRY